MLEFLCLFFPAVLGTALTEKLLQKRFPGKETVYLFSLECLCVYFFVFLLKRFLFHSAIVPLNPQEGMTISAAMNYLIVALPAVPVFASLTALVLKKADLGLEKNNNLPADDHGAENHE